MVLFGWLFLLLYPFLGHSAQMPAMDAILDRAAEEARRFAAEAPQLASVETCHQRALKQKRRRGLRFGKPKEEEEVGAVEYSDRIIVSEYRFGSFRDAPERIHELRSVRSVDGKTVKGSRPIQELTGQSGSGTPDARRRELLEAFAKHSLEGAAIDFGQLLLLFHRSSQPNYEYSILGQQSTPTGKFWVVEFVQKKGDQSLLVVGKEEAERKPLAGELWVEQRTLIPRKIVLRTSREDEKSRTIDDEAQVEYQPSAQGVLTPIRVEYRQKSGEVLLFESVMQYEPFQPRSVQSAPREAERP